MTEIMNHERFAEAFFLRSLSDFMAVLKRDSQDPSVWEARKRTFKTHGLTTFAELSPFKPKEVKFEPDRLDEPGYKAWFIRKLKAPRPGKWIYHEIHIDRAKLCSDSKYLTDMAKLLSHKWVEKLLPVADAVTAMLLLKQTESSLSASLDGMRLNDSTNEAVGRCILRTHCQEALDKNETLKQHCQAIADAGAEARRVFAAEMAPIAAQVMRDFEESSDRILSDVRAQTDAFQGQLSERIAQSAAQSKKVLEESGLPANYDPQAEFYKEVTRREAERKAANKWSTRSKLLLWLGIAGVAVILGFHLEIAGTTPVEALTGLFK